MRQFPATLIPLSGVMKDVLVICSDTDVVGLIESTVSQKTRVTDTPDVSTSLASYKGQFDLVFLDVTLLQNDVRAEFDHIMLHFRRFSPLVQFVVLAPKQLVRQAVEAVKQGANDYLTYPIDSEEIRLVIETAKQGIARKIELEYLRDRFWKSDWLEIILTHGPDMRRVYETIRSVAPTIATVLLLGETGTGKGLMARLIHRHSQRSEAPFVVVHCGAIPDTLIESELFGHERGAFTGADRRRIGQFEMARGGTIFLDEIGTITASAQIKLLQVLQDGTFSRIGGVEPLRTDARIIAATNADLEQMVDSGTFRRDLFYRLNVFPIEIPPLRQRLEDLPHLIDLFLANLNKKYGKKIRKIYPGILECLQSYSWPGNLRELENMLERAYILETGDILMPERFPDTLIRSSRIAQGLVQRERDLPLAEARQIAIDEFERLYLTRLLEKHRGKIGTSAREADITPRQLSRLIAKHGLEKRNFKA